MKLRLLLPGLLSIACLTLAGAQPPDASSEKTYLLNVSKGQLPSDTGQDDKTKPEIVDNFKDLGGGKALKIAFNPADSFGGQAGAKKDWRRFARFRFDAFNPGKEAVSLTLNVVHSRSTNLQTRVVMPIKLRPCKNEVAIGTDEMVNVNGSTPNLASVVRWYIADADSKGPTVYFSDIWLEGADAPAASGPLVPSGPQPLVGYKIKGKVGDLNIDLTVTPFLAGSTAPKPVAVEGDPARIARIRAAKMPKFDKPLMFDTPEADAVLSALEVFPPDNPWNLVVTDWPLHPLSKKIVASVGPDKPFRYNPDMGFILVPPDQKKVDVKLTGYAGESDRGPFPVPANTPIEGWPVGYQDKKQTLDDVQRDKLNENSDRHALVVDPVNRMLYEFYQMKKTDAGWQASQSSIFDLKSNAVRPDGWTSSDAAGLPIFPSVVRYDELKRGEIEHALRVSVVRTKREYVYPARHYASKLTDEDLPRMGERFRLRKDFDISGFKPEVQTILKALKKYGMFVADNGIDWAISVAPDSRIPVLHDELRKIKGSDFEVVTPPQGYKQPSE
jgi:hypothetical protein